VIGNGKTYRSIFGTNLVIDELWTRLEMIWGWIRGREWRVNAVEGGSCCVGSGSGSNTWSGRNGSVSGVGSDAEEKNASSGRGWMIRGREGGWLRKK
jgi:hypothetical protein